MVGFYMFLTVTAVQLKINTVQYYVFCFLIILFIIIIILFFHVLVSHIEHMWIKSRVDKKNGFYNLTVSKGLLIVGVYSSVF